MSVKKCSNCGANIPSGAGFCPGCGEKILEKQEESKTQPATVQSKQIRTGQGGLQELMTFLFSLKIMVIFLVISLIVAWITKIINQYQTSYSSGFTVVNIVNFTFMAGIGGLLFFGGLLNHKINIYLRTALMITGAIFLVLNL